MFVTWRKFRKKDSMNSGIQILTLSLQCFFLIWWEVIWGPSHVSFRSHHLNLWSGRLCLSLSKMVSLFHFNGAGWKWRDEDADTFYTELRLLPNMTRFTWDAKVRGSCVWDAIFRPWGGGVWHFQDTVWVNIYFHFIPSFLICINVDFRFMEKWPQFHHLDM